MGQCLDLILECSDEDLSVISESIPYVQSLRETFSDPYWKLIEFNLKTAAIIIKSRKEKKLCELVGIDFKPVMGSHTTGSYIAAASYRNWPSTNSLKTKSDLQRFAAQVKS